MLVTWNKLESSESLDKIIQDSHSFPQIIFKHSTTCSISYIAKLRLDESIEDLSKKFTCYYLDLLNYRSISNEVAEKLQVHHESPQLIIVNNGEASYDESHLDISIVDIEEHYRYLMDHAVVE